MLNLANLRLIISIIGLLLSVTLLSDQLFAYNMQDAVYQTLQSHPEILSSKADSAAAAQDIKIAQGGLYPSLDITAGIGRENSGNPATRSTGSSSRTFTRRESQAFLKQLVFDGGNARNKVSQKRFDYNATRHRITEVQQSLAFDAVAAYHDILRAQEILAVRRLDVKAHRDLVNKIDRRLTAGGGRKSELSLAKARLALATSRLEAAQGHLENAKDTFNKVVGQPAPRDLKKPGLPKNIPKSESYAQAVALQESPSIKVTESEALASGAAIKLAQSAFYPRFTLDLSTSYNNNLDGVPGRNEDAQAMLKMTYNVLKGGSDLANLNASRNRERAAVENIAKIKRDVVEDVSLS